MKNFVCPFCGRKYVPGRKGEGKFALYNHMEVEHKEDLQGLPPAQIYFNFKNKYNLYKGNGKSVISGKPTPFNLVSERYERFLPSEAVMYRKIFIDRMRRVYGKDTLLNEPDQQKKMLANRRISGEYEFSDGIKKTFTGSYEKAFLQYLDVNLRWPSTDVMTPAPQIFPYEIDGKLHFHIPDVFIPSLGLILNIKASDNNGYRLRDIEIENMQDNLVRNSQFKYIKIFDKNYKEFEDFVDENKIQA